jgi:regulator of sigma E protease
MFFQILSIVLALVGISFLIFIHELGHYWAAKLVGMRVEVFSIGFGKPFLQWRFGEERWQLCVLPFGGYVKIAGQDQTDSSDPYKVPGGYYSKPPLSRIFVALAGPLMNILFAFLFFLALFFSGGKERSFSEVTHKIGWVDPQSKLFEQGVRPGDELIAFDDHPYTSSKDLLFLFLTQKGDVTVKGRHVNYETKEKIPFSYSVTMYPYPQSIDPSMLTAGILQQASYIIYDKVGGKENPLPEGSPMRGSGIMYGDRIVWIDGELIFSLQQLNRVLNDERIFLTVKRGNKVIHRRVPLLLLRSFRLSTAVKAEIEDWQFEEGLNGKKIEELVFIPYNLTDSLVVEEPLSFIDQEEQKEAFPEIPFSELEEPLLVGDEIIAVGETPVSSGHQLLKEVQEKKVLVIVERPNLPKVLPSAKNADQYFDQSLDQEALKKIVSSLGTSKNISKAGKYHLLHPVVPKRHSEFTLSATSKEQWTNLISEQRKKIESIEDPDKRAQALNLLENHEKQLLLGLPGVQDKKVLYNPGPFEAFASIVSEIKRTLYSLVTGTLNPKWMSGPIGVIQVVQKGATAGLNESLYWMGFISLNLGIINLLPIPVLDGGMILLSLFELLSGKKIKPKTLELLIIPFAILLLFFFIFLTYNDLTRIWELFF